MPSYVRRQPEGTWRTEQMDNSEDFTQLWERHIAAARKDFSRTREEETIDDTDEVGRCWDERINSVVDAMGLDDIAVQSPHSRGTHSPEPLWSARDDYTETALSSPQESHFSTNLKPSLPQPTITISDYDEFADAEPGTPMVEIGGRRSKGKELASYYLDKSRLKKHSDRHTGHVATPTVDSKQKAYKKYTSRYIPFPDPNAVEPETPITSFRDVLRIQNTPPEEAHVLVLTWAKHDRRGDDGQLLSPGLDIETDTVRACFKRRGYRVQCRLIPEDYPTSAVETILDKFLAKSKEGSLLVVYYHGYGNMEADRMVFSSGFGGSYFYWDDVRDPIMQAPGEVLMVMDCSAAPGAEQPEIVMEPGLAASPSTKQLLGVCAPYSFDSGMGAADNFMTKSLCRVLDEGEENGEAMVSVQNLCSQMKEDLRGQGFDASTVFVTQLGGGQLLDIYLPRF